MPMGPNTLFDKSFLQSLSVDESVLFDHFFLANVCPPFYVETLADLEKSVRNGRTPEQEVGVISDKFPEMHGLPNSHHLRLCLGNLLGDKIPMDGRIPVAGGQTVKAGDRIDVIYERSPELEAFLRWQKGEFLEIERLYARAWRESLESLDLKEFANTFKALGINGKTCKTLDDAKRIAENIIHSSNKALLLFNVPTHLHKSILQQWSIMNYPPLSSYAPYAAFVLTVEIFFQVALTANLISSERPSNRTDLAYLFYLPFSMVFVSSDKLHRKCAPLFMRNDQEFIWGEELKNDLKRLNKLYSGLSNETKEKGMMSFASSPPKDGKYLVSTIWDHHLRKWRECPEIKTSRDPEKDAKLVEELKKKPDTDSLPPNEVEVESEDVDTFSIQRMVRKRKGSWYQVPKDLEPDKDQK